jgi:micrococcal nuclease
MCLADVPMQKCFGKTIKVITVDALKAPKLLKLLAIGLLGVNCCWAETAIVTRCHDGDTCHLKRLDGTSFKARLYGVDTPESEQAYGPEAKRFIENLIKGKQVVVNCHGRSDDRQTCDLFLSNGQSVQEMLVKLGYAWDYPQFSKKHYAALQLEAKNARLGLWSQTNIVSPYCFRYTGVAECESTHNQVQP